MKIRTIHIYGFGQFENKMFQLQPTKSLHVLFGHNEAGKSTITAFILAIFFGFPARNQTENRYEPKTGAKYGGKVTVETADKVITIERVKGRSTGELLIFNEDGTVCEEDEREALFKGLDRALYQSIFSFGFKGLQAIENVTSTELSHYLFTAGTTGGQALFEMEKKLTKKLDELYKPSGRKPLLNEKLAELECVRNELKKWEGKVELYNKYVQEQERLKVRLNEMGEKITQLQSLVKEYEKKQMLEPHITERKKWQIQLSQISDFEPFPVNGLERLAQLQTEMRPLKGQALSLSQKISDLQKEMDATNYKEDSIAQEVKVRSLKEKQKVYEMQEIEKEKISLSLTYEQEEINVIIGKLGSGYNEEIINEIDISLTIKEQLKNLITKVERLNNQQTFLDEQFNKAKAELEQAEAALQKLKKEKQKNKKPMLAVILSLLATFAGGIILWVLSESIYPLVISVIILLGLSLYKFTFKNAKNQQIEKEQVLLKQKEKIFDDIVKQYESWEQEFHQAEQELAAFCCKHKFPNELPATLLMSAFEWLEELKKRIRTKSHLLLERERLEKEVTIFTADVKELIEIFNLQTEFSLLALDKIIDIIEKEKEKKYRVYQLNEKGKEYHDELTALEQQMQYLETEIKVLFSSANVEDEDSFRQKGKANEEYSAVKAKLQAIESYLQSVLKAGEERYIDEIANENIHYEQIIDKTTEAITNADSERKQLQVRLADISVEIKNLEEGTAYSDLVHRYEVLKDEFQREAGEWAVYKVAKDLIDRTKDYYRMVRLPQVIQTAQTYFSFLTFDKYPLLNAPTEDSGFIVERHDGIRFTPNELSQATTEQLYLSLRLSLARNFRSITPLPIIIDDSFVNFDKERTKRALELIREIAKDHQILFFTCHQHIVELFDEAEMIKLEGSRG
ncbi:MAG TPA: AAA family ATPase [Bacillus bacterium]|nr:AAA family ATPase [Bacillus sp. (in: firmicutes)]